MPSIPRGDAIVTLAIVVIVAALVLNLFRSKQHPLGPENELIFKIREKGISAEERERLISELDELPMVIHQFYSRWLNVHDISPFEAWNETGYDPTRSEVPRDIQLLWAANYGTSDILNGGLHQFFGNGTGSMAPEIAEWFARAGFEKSAAVLREAMLEFGEPFPRSQPQRRKFLDDFADRNPPNWDPFEQFDGEFYASLDREEDAFDRAADRWLREVCGIASLHDGWEQPNRGGGPDL